MTFEENLAQATAMLQRCGGRAYRPRPLQVPRDVVSLTARTTERQRVRALQRRDTLPHWADAAEV